MSEALSYYKQAEKQANKAGELLADANENYKKFNELSEIIRNWDSFMGNASPVVFTIVLIVAAILEYLFSIDLYRDLMKRTPWLIPVGIIAGTIFISHLYLLALSKSAREKEFYDRKRNIQHKNKTDDEIHHEIRRTMRRNLIWGIILSLAITIFILLMSHDRVERELAAEMRKKPFGFYDLWPVIFYILEIFAGIFALYVIRRISLGIKKNNLKNKFDKLISEITSLTSAACNSFEKAEELGFDTLNETIAESIHIAFYRNKNYNPSQEEEFLTSPENKTLKVKLKISRSDNKKPLNANIHLLTEYNFSATGTTDENGNAEITFRSFDNDTIREIIAEFSDSVSARDQVNFTVNNEEPHGIIFMV